MYLRDMNGEISEEKEIFCDCVGKECPFYEVLGSGRIEKCKKANAELKGENK